MNDERFDSVPVKGSKFFAQYPGERIKAKALELGFSKAGIAEVVPLTVEADRLHDWLSRGYHASMLWMQRNADKRTNPTLVVPGARSIVCLALNYYTNERHVDEPGKGKISRYAWGDDYHDIVQRKLKLLWNWMEKQFPGIEGRYYVDTGPVMEKVWAERAGIGWIGKHTNLITQDLGSWIFLGEIISTLPLDPDQPATDHCGTCTLCIEACPTGAITDPYVVDSNRCLSYLTIEHHGQVDPGLAGKTEGWIYGCDICQDVCPWNERFAQQTREFSFEPREPNRSPLLQDWESMSEDEFRRMFRGSPIKRTKHAGLMRNVKMAMEKS